MSTGLSTPRTATWSASLCREHPDFDVTQINPATVSLDGALPIAQFTKRFPHSEFLNETFVFVGKDISLPAGYTTATFTAQTYSGQQITSSKQVLNVPFSAKVPGRLHCLMDKGIGLSQPDEAREDFAGLRQSRQHHPADSDIRQARPRLDGGGAIDQGQLPLSDRLDRDGHADRDAAHRCVCEFLAFRRQASNPVPPGCPGNCNRA